MPTIADAHRNYALGKVLADVGRELAVLYGLDTQAHEDAAVGCLGHIAELTAIEAPPANLQAHVDTNMQASRDATEAAIATWAAVDEDDPQAKYLYPLEYQHGQTIPGLAAANRQQAEFYLAAIDEAWTPGGGS